MAEVDERYRVAMQQCDYLASEILAERARHARELTAAEQRAHAAEVQARAADEVAAAAHAQADRLEHQFNHARAIIKDMERSRFWRMRMLWVRLTRRSRA
jgi:cell division septum initiation protein DivIVA